MVRQLNVALEGSPNFWFLGLATSQQNKLATLYVVCPRNHKIHNNTNTITPLSRGFLHSPRRTIAASVARVRKMCEGDKKVQSPHHFTNGSV